MTSAYELTSRGLLVCSSAEHVLIPSTEPPADVTGFLMALQRSLPPEVFDPAGTEARTTVDSFPPVSVLLTCSVRRPRAATDAGPRGKASSGDGGGVHEGRAKGVESECLDTLILDDCPGMGKSSIVKTL